MAAGALGVALLAVLAPVPAHALTSPQLTITASPSTTVGLQIFANSNLMSAANPTGTLTFRLYAPSDPSCTTAVFTSTVAVTGTSVDSERYTTTTAGTWRWTSSYSGDSNYSAASTLCSDANAGVIVDKARPAMSVAAQALTLGALHATVTLSGGYQPTGSIGFYLYLETPTDLFCASAPLFTSTVPVAAAGTFDSGAFIPTLAGTYKWRATYSGDTNNRAISITGCNDSTASVVVSLLQLTPVSGRYIPVDPARILDTRDGTGGATGPVGPGATVGVQVSGHGGVPTSGVIAVAMTVTVTQPTASSWLTVYPSGTLAPLASNLNFSGGETIANLVVAKLGSDGKVNVYNAAGSVHVIADVTGWYAASSTGTDGHYHALVPARVYDSRTGTGGGVRLTPGASVDVAVAGAGGVPATGVVGVTLNVAVTNATAPSYLTVFPTGSARPLAANLGFVGGDTVSNRVVAMVGTGGKISIYNAAGSVDVIVDVGGWYGDASDTTTGGLYTPLAPARVLDTRDGTGGVSGPVPANGTVDVQVTGRGGVPSSGVSAVVLNATVTSPAAGGYLTIFPSGTARPVASDLNYAAGETRPNLVVVKVGPDGKVSLFTSAGTQAVFDVAGWIS